MTWSNRGLTGLGGGARAWTICRLWDEGRMGEKKGLVTGRSAR